MTAPDTRDPCARTLAAPALLLATLLGLCACGAVPAPPGMSGYAQTPGVYFHNNVVVSTSVGGSFSSR